MNTAEMILEIWNRGGAPPNDTQSRGGEVQSPQGVRL